MLKITATALVLCCALPVAAQSAPAARQNPQTRSVARSELEQLRNELRELRQTIERLCQSMAAHGQGTEAAPHRAMGLQGQPGTTRALTVTPSAPRAPRAAAPPLAPQPPQAVAAPAPQGQGVTAAPLRIARARTAQPGEPAQAPTALPLRVARTAQPLPPVPPAPLPRVSVPSFQNHAGCTCDCPCCQQARRAGAQGALAPMRASLRAQGATGDRNCAPRRAAVQRVEGAPETANPPAAPKKVKVKKVEEKKSEDKKTLISV